MLAFQNPVGACLYSFLVFVSEARFCLGSLCMPGIFCMSQKNSQQVFLLASRAKKLWVSFFLALLASRTKNSRPRVGLRPRVGWYY
jgi:hypothetical protein